MTRLLHYSMSDFTCLGDFGLTEKSGVSVLNAPKSLTDPLKDTARPYTEATGYGRTNQSD